MILTKRLTIGIDATNLRAGGGVTHLVELLRFANPTEFEIDRVVVWGGSYTLSALENRPWLDKRNPLALDKSLFRRGLWQRNCLSKAARDARCDVLFVPGGSFVGDFHPVVTMSQNLLPFEFSELKRFGWSISTLKLLVLRIIQTFSFRNSDGVIFLTEYSRHAVLRVTGALDAKTAIIAHGLNPRFYNPPKPQYAISDYDQLNPFHVIYVSIINQYKHQSNVVEAIAALRRKGFPVVLDLVGPAYQPALKRLHETIARQVDGYSWVSYHGAIPFSDLHLRYADADLGLFASSCENMPNILLETMASGLPVACSNRGPMPEILGESGIYFDPENPEDIARAIEILISQPLLRSQFAAASFEKSKHYTWKRCADQTFQFLLDVHNQNIGAK